MRNVENRRDDQRQVIRVIGDTGQIKSTRCYFLRNKRNEWNDYRRQVTEFELGRYLPIL